MKEHRFVKRHAEQPPQQRVSGAGQHHKERIGNGNVANRSSNCQKKRHNGKNWNLKIISKTTTLNGFLYFKERFTA